MRTYQNAILSFGLSTLAFAAFGCASGRTPEVYRDDTEKVLQSASDNITNCYSGILKGGSPTAQGSVTVSSSSRRTRAPSSTRRSTRRAPPHPRPCRRA